MSAKISVSITVVPTSGGKRNETVVVEATGTTLRDVLKTANVDPKNMDLTIDGKPAKLDDFVGAKAKVGAKARSVSVEVAERPAGS